MPNIHTVDGQIEWAVGSVRSVGFLIEFESHMVVLGVGNGPIGFAAPWSFQMLDSQAEKSKMGLVSIDFVDSPDFQQSHHGSLTRYYSFFRPG